MSVTPRRTTRDVPGSTVSGADRPAAPGASATIDIRRTASHRLEIVVHGVMDEHDVHHLFERLDGDFDVGGEQSLLLDLRALERLTVNAHVRDLIYRTRRYGRHGKLGRVAIVGGPRRLGLRARLHGALLRGLAIRRFDTASFELAERWLNARST